MMYDIPFVPSSDDAVSTIVMLSAVQPGDAAIDLGAGDGKLVIALAQAGATAHGVEIDRERFKLANAAIADRGLAGKARVMRGSLWEQDLAPYDLIVLYGVPSIMEKLSQKIINEAKRTVRIVSNHFEFPDWTPAKVKNSVFLYRPNMI